MCVGKELERKEFFFFFKQKTAYEIGRQSSRISEPEINPNSNSNLLDVAGAAEADVRMRDPRVLGVDVRGTDRLLGSHERASLEDPELGLGPASRGRRRPRRRPLPHVA